ncbi:uncharacterized protein LOC122503329 [Leptopilina heterotoma]|uniref:uncharacterized protein LOC122503329 n=1 Tax=Leptopilina heterotoma TaxID=63436 RepID=UPI001CA7D910|nr:uncharacterized protein LOC122503329 [Leptopilina heterotoma]XP_043469759.1 uncharacterized protein LOC122503329 [Leptopilina heterotoma]XP_043469760.1 uncharacterized protein LOC122503329 [Leptopilina heterotoma]
MSEIADYFKKNIIGYSSDEMIKAVCIGELTVELIAYVESVIPPQRVGKQMVQKCILNNASGSRILVKIWNEQIDRVKACIQPNFILHVDSASARHLTNFSKELVGNVNFELYIQSHTRINVLGVREVNTDCEKIEAGI